MNPTPRNRAGNRAGNRSGNRSGNRAGNRSGNRAGNSSGSLPGAPGRCPPHGLTDKSADNKSEVPLHGSSPSPAPAERRQTLRENSVPDLSNGHTQYGPIGSGLTRRSNTMDASAGGPVNFRGMAPTAPQGYGSAFPSSSAQDPRGRSASTPQTSGDPTRVTANVAPMAGLQALLAAGLCNINIAAERENPDFDASRPLFLQGVVFNPLNPGEWYDIVLPALSARTFVFTSTTDLHYASDISARGEIPSVHQAVTRVAMPNFFWFSGVAHNRRHNPYFQVCASLPNLTAICFCLHTAGITTSRFGERQMIELEATDPVRAKERKTMSVPEVVEKYELNGLFRCLRLRRVRIEYIDCEMTRVFTKVGDVVVLLREVQAFLYAGFGGSGGEVVVELARVG